MLFLIGLFLARGQKVTALNDQVQQAQTRVESYAKTTIADQAIVDTRADTITFDKKDFAVAVEGDIFTDPAVARVRVWDKDGVLLASSDPNEVVGQLKVTKDENFTSALTNELTQSHVVQETFAFATVGSPAVPANLLEVTTPFMVKNQIEPVGVVQMDVYYAKLQTAAREPLGHDLARLPHRRDHRRHPVRHRDGAQASRRGRGRRARRGAVRGRLPGSPGWLRRRRAALKSSRRSSRSRANSCSRPPKRSPSSRPA